MAVFGLLGYPLGHSFSKPYFEEKFRTEGLPHQFINLELENIKALPELVTNQSVQGFSVTRPHKQAVLAFLHEQSDAVAAMGACNCVQIDAHGQWHGHNTDAPGFWNSLPERLQQPGLKAMVLGDGGAALAVRYALTTGGYTVQTVVRKPVENAWLYQDITAGQLQSFDLIVNTTPVGTWPDTDNCPLIPYEHLRPGQHLFDLVYNPAETTFLKKGLAAECTVQNGHQMLIGQAELNWQLWKATL